MSKLQFYSWTEILFYEQIEFYPSGGTTFKVIGEGFIAIDNLTVGFVDSEVRLLI